RCSPMARIFVSECSPPPTKQQQNSAELNYGGICTAVNARLRGVLNGHLLLAKCPFRPGRILGMAQEETKLAEVKPLLTKGKDGYWRKQRQKHSHEKKLQVVSEALTHGASVSAVARRHGINTNLVFSWIRMYENGCLLSPSRRDLEREMQKFVVAGLLPKPQEPGERQHLPEGGMIEIENGSGVKVRLTASVDGKTLA